jgi:hypothetical protein
MAEQKTFEVRIDSILGGHSQSSHFSSPGQFRTSIAIDPSLPSTDTIGDAYSNVASGLLRPVAVTDIGNSIIANSPMWLIPNPKDSSVYIYDLGGSAYVTGGSVVTALSDGGTLTSSSGNGAEYYDNYIYFFKNTDVARYGPLNGAPTFNGTYWTGTLGKAALTNTTYPSDFFLNTAYPNHVAHRHSDGKLYFADVVGNQGTIHVISTTKAAVEGDTDSGSTASKLTFGYGLWPTAIESYGSSLAIALLENTNATKRGMRAKMAFWDTTSGNFNSIIWVEFPDSIITGLKNVDGTLYIVSGNLGVQGFRVSQYVGGNTVSEVGYFEDGEPPFPGALEGSSKRLLFGSFSATPVNTACVYSLGLQKSGLTSGLFNTVAPTSGTDGSVTSLLLADNLPLAFDIPWVGNSSGSGLANQYLDVRSTTYGLIDNIFWSQMFRIGKPFKITKIRIPFSQAIASGMSLIVNMYVDDGSKVYTGTANAMPTITSSNYLGERGVVFTPTGVTGKNNLWLGLDWNGTALLTVGLPIIIEGEILDD